MARQFNRRAGKGMAFEAGEMEGCVAGDEHALDQAVIFLDHPAAAAILPDLEDMGCRTGIGGTGLARDAPAPARGPPAMARRVVVPRPSDRRGGR